MANASIGKSFESPAKQQASPAPDTPISSFARFEMNWSKLLPSTLNPAVLFRQLFADDHNIATQALRDMVIFLTFSIAAVFAACVLWQTIGSWLRTRKYLQVTGDSKKALDEVITSDLSLFRELRHHLVEKPLLDGSGKTSKRRTVDATEVFREAALGPSFSSSRLTLAIPSILTGFGVLGTFVGLQLGISSLDFNNLEASIKPLINSCAVAFSSSVWGVGASLLFSWWEKAWEGFALGRVRKIQNRVDALFPRYVPEEALLEMERTSRGTEELLKGLAVAIGAEMQTAIRSLGAEIKDAVSSATAEGHGPLMEKSSELLSNALTKELVKLKEQIGLMADQFSEKFNGASDGLMKSVQGFQPTVEALSGAVGDAQRTVTNAVEKLNAHESVMQDMAGAATNIRQAAANAIGQVILQYLTKPENLELFDTVFVEGHTDSVPNTREMGNWGLSTYRAISLWNYWTEMPGKLAELKNLRTVPADPKVPAKPLISVSGYADTRSTHGLLEGQQLKNDRPEDRRIDIRFTLASSEKQSLEKLQGNMAQMRNKTEALIQKLKNPGHAP
jgi:hypothetical protein